jgi:hypothetical protein
LSGTKEEEKKSISWGEAQDENFIFSAHAYKTHAIHVKGMTQKKLFEYIILLYDRDGKSMFKSTRDKVWHLPIIYVYACIYQHRDQYYASIQHSLESRKMSSSHSYIHGVVFSTSTDRKKIKSELCRKGLQYLL